MYSQNEEEKYITEYFDGRTGTFIDIGAFDVFALSNTRRLYELGWSGVLVEADPTNYKKISDHYKDDERIKVVNTAVGVSSEPLEFWTSNGDAVSTSVTEHKTKWERGGVNFTKITIGQTRIYDFLDEYFTKDVKFISLDTEATNLVLFEAMPDYVFEQIDMFCIEHDGGESQIEARLLPFGFRRIYWNAENLLLAK